MSQNSVYQNIFSDKKKDRKPSDSHINTQT